MIKLCVVIWSDVSFNVLFLFRSGKNLACCLWGSYAEKIENLARDSLEETTVWLLRFAKIGEFRGNCFLNILFLITKNDPQCFFIR